MDLFIIQTGGTIDKEYPQRVGAYGFEINMAAATRIVQRARVIPEIHSITCCKKDSQDIDDSDRNELLSFIQKIPEGRIIITHGTDSMIETARWLDHRTRRPLVITGSYIPYSCKDSDADFNVGMAMAATEFIREGTYIVMNGIISPAALTSRDRSSGLFYTIKP